jgi:predicted hydrocarbon binding protein
MKGILFQLLEQASIGRLGEDAWDVMTEAAGVEGAYTSLGTYPDDEFERLTAAAASVAGEGPDDVLRWFGRAAIPLLADRYPAFFKEHASTRDFLMTLNDIIHVEVRKLYPEARVPSFDFEVSEPALVVMRYHSDRTLCMLAEGLVAGAAGYFGERVSIHQPECTHRGDATCVLVCAFGP